LLINGTATPSFRYFQITAASDHHSAHEVINRAFQSISGRKGSIPVWDKLESLFGVPQQQLRETQSTPGGNPAIH
jgi:hypothetical protein